MSLKKEVRIIGIDDVPFDKFKDLQTKIFGVIYRGGYFMEGVVSETINVDGSDSTEKIIKMIKGSRFYKQIKYIMLDGIAVGGFNIIEVSKLSRETNRGVVVVMRKKPGLKKIRNTLDKLGMQDKISLLQGIGRIHEINMDKGILFFQNYGIKRETAEGLLKITCTNSLIPEPIRVAHIMGKGITTGESKGSG